MAIHKLPTLIPKVIVLDIDDCAFTKDSYNFTHPPSNPIISDLSSHGKGIKSVHCGKTAVSLHPGALELLQQTYLAKIGENSEPRWSEINVAIASSACGRISVDCIQKAFDMLEVLPGTTVRQAINKGWDAKVLSSARNFHSYGGHVWVGRTEKLGLSSNKGKSHFPRIKEFTAVEYSQMLFFDDNSWSDNFVAVRARCPGVICQHTPKGMQVNELYEGLAKYYRFYNSEK